MYSFPQKSLLLYFEPISSYLVPGYLAQNLSSLPQERQPFLCLYLPPWSSPPLTTLARFFHLNNPPPIPQRKDGIPHGEEVKGIYAWNRKPWPSRA